MVEKKRKKFIQPITSKIDIHKLEDKSKREEYQLEAKQNFIEHIDIKKPQEQWDHITKSCIKAGEKYLECVEIEPNTTTKNWQNYLKNRNK